MAGADRQPAADVTPGRDGRAGGAEPAGPGAARAFLDRLLAEPWRFDLFQALRVIEAAHPDRPPLGRGRRAADEPARLGQPPELGFPPAELERVEPATAGRGLAVRTRAIGLFGPHGPLPLWLTARARAQARQEGDRSLADFADLFHHRMIALYYRAWAEARPAVEQDRGRESRTTARLRALLGLDLGPPDRSPVPERFLLFVAGLLLVGSRPPEALERALALYLGVPARLVEFQGAWLELPERWRTRLGSGRLGEDTILGLAVWNRAHRFRVRLGPLGRDDLEALLPDGALLPAVVALVVIFAGRELDFDLNLVVRREEVPEARLGGRTRLGWTSWLAARERARDAEDLVLERVDRGLERGERPWP